MPPEAQVGQAVAGAFYGFLWVAFVAGCAAISAGIVVCLLEGAGFLSRCWKRRRRRKK